MLLRRLPGGSFAETFVARDLTSERQVVVKLLRDEYTRDPGFVRRFEREAQHALAVSHPNVVHVIDTGQDAETIFLVMEWVEGRDLKQRIIDEAPLEVNQAVAIILDVLAGLEAVHAAGIIHRDIKPQNILIDGDGRAKIADFGIARAASDTGITHTGQAAGTAAYMAPEQASGGRISDASDLCAVGVVLFELVTGRLPFFGTNAVRVMYQHVTEPPPSPRTFNRLVPASLDGVILRALAKDPVERFTSSSAFRAALLRLERPPTVIGQAQLRHDLNATTVISPTAAVWAAPIMGPHGSATLVPPLIAPQPGHVRSHPAGILGVVALSLVVLLAVFVLDPSRWPDDDDGDGTGSGIVPVTATAPEPTDDDLPTATAAAATSTPTAERTAITDLVIPLPASTDTIPVVTPTPSPPSPTLAPPTATATAPPAMPPNPVPFQTEVSVPSDHDMGVTFEVPTSGRYAIALSGGAYSPWPDGSRQWRTIVHIYVGREISWHDCRGYGHIEPCDPDLRIGLWEDDTSRPGQAAAAAAGSALPPLVVDLQAGTILRFVTIDEQGAYAYPGPNTGTVTLSISSTRWPMTSVAALRSARE